ncbi:Fe-only nitrogenase accessory AnfO family protein [Azotosporobacter soli]|uniref:Fe-only nitrogenase accessory AnfO family protein n=1 Tax=Azotosporobacter soli TaxID=3055040 RepID=UPI0031FEEB73
MASEVGVFINKAGLSATLYEPGRLAVYAKQNGNWRIVRQIPFGLDTLQGIKQMRWAMAEAVGFLADCKVVVGEKINGMPYFELEKAGCNIWEFSGSPMEFLPYVAAEEEQARRQETIKSAVEIPAPKEIADGCFSVSIKEIQALNSGITSKQILQPFLRKGSFQQLEVVCSHVPPWLEEEMLSGKLSGELKKSGNSEMTLQIRKAQG